MENGNGISIVGEKNGTTGQGYDVTEITSVVINVAIQLSPQWWWWGYYLLQWVILFLFKKVNIKISFESKVHVEEKNDLY